MPRGFDHNIRKQVDMNVDQGDGSYPKGRCLHCDKIIAVTASTIKRHLKGCAPYEKHRQEHPELHPETTELTPRRSINKTPKTPKSAPHPGAPGGLLAHAPVNLVTEAGAQAARYQAAKAVYVTGQPLTLYSDPAMRDMFRTLNPAFRPPTEEELANELLDQVYDEYMKRVRQIIDGLPWLNITLEATEHSGDNMVLDVAVCPAPGMAYYWTRINTGDIAITASNRLQLLRPILVDITNGNINRIMSYSMSTERAFREVNFAYCPVRNHLSHDKLEKIMFIYYNHRTLKIKQKSWPQLTEAEIEEMETLLFQR